MSVNISTATKTIGISGDSSKQYRGARVSDYDEQGVWIDFIFDGDPDTIRLLFEDTIVDGEKLTLETAQTKLNG